MGQGCFVHDVHMSDGRSGTSMLISTVTDNEPLPAIMPQSMVTIRRVLSPGNFSVLNLPPVTSILFSHIIMNPGIFTDVICDVDSIAGIYYCRAGCGLMLI